MISNRLLLVLGCVVGLGLVVACGDDDSAAKNADQSQIANPASEHCEEQGYTLEIREDPAGNQHGVCKFPDGTMCEEWAFFRGECGLSDDTEIQELPTPWQ